MDRASEEWLSRLDGVQMASKLLPWFEANARKLPWRGSKNPYAVWVSEVMLQQTQVATVIGHYKKWMEALPSIKALASAEQQQILKLWEGLGYYSRAKNLHRAATIIQEEHGGQFPKKYESIIKLPGIGPYTAGAISSFVFGEAQAAVDGNAERVLCRVLDLKTPLETLRSKKTLQRIAKELLPERKPGTFNEALIELGATLCTPKKPACHLCPLRSRCEGFLAGSFLLLPVKSRAQQAIKRRTSSFVLQHRGRFLLVRRSNETLMEGLWEFPTIEHKDANATPTEKGLRAVFERSFGYEVGAIKPLFSVRHAYTKYRVNMEVFAAEVFGGGSNAKQGRSPMAGQWLLPSELLQKPLNAASLKTLKQLSALEHGGATLAKNPFKQMNLLEGDDRPRPT